MMIRSFIITVTLLVFIGCSTLDNAYSVGKVVAPIVVKDKKKLEKLKSIDEVVTIIKEGLEEPPKNLDVNTSEVLAK